MGRYFYSHLTDTDSLTSDLGELELTEGQKKELMEIAHIHTHQAVVDAILSQLSEDDKKKFLELLAAGANDEIWKHLNEKVSKIEDTITQVAKQVKKELREDVIKVKKS